MKYSGAPKLKRSERRLLKDLVPDGTNYHNYLGAVDSKHLAMKKPPNAGSFYYNYKGFHQHCTHGRCKCWNLASKLDNVSVEYLIYVSMCICTIHAIYVYMYICIIR